MIQYGERLSAWELHRAVIRYGEAMRLAGMFRERNNHAGHVRALDVSVIVHKRILDMVP